MPQLQHYTPRRTALATAVAMLASPAIHAGTLPNGGVVVGGNAVATISQNGANTAMTVNQSAQSAIINWNGFSIGAGDSVQFVQPNVSAVALNRVTGNLASTISGNLSANGRVFLVNPNGVLFAGGSQVNVGGLVASTLAISDADFNTGVANGHFAFTATGFSGNVPITNSGTITAANGGTVALLGDAANSATGVISADSGTVALASGTSITLDFQGDGLTQLTVGGAPGGGADVVNAGTLQADGGQVVMRAVSITDANEMVVRQSGTIRARSLENRGGQIILSGGDEGQVSVAGVLDASALATNAAGGKVSIDGRSLQVGEDPAAITTAGNGSGANGTLSITSDNSLYVTADRQNTDDSFVSQATLSSALDTASLVTLSARGTPAGATTPSAGDVRFLADANVQKTDAAAGKLQVDADRDITMAAGSAIAASGNGALDIAFNADANAQGAGVIGLTQASIASHGGDVAFYGQSDAVDGRAIGHLSTEVIVAANVFIPGIVVSDSRIDTRNAAGGGDAAISLRGAGSASSNARGNSGVAIAGSDLNTGSGEITIDGIGGLGRAGVVVTDSNTQDNVASNIVSTSGAIRIGGVSPDQADPAQTLEGATPFGVLIENSRVATGGDVTISGTGGDLSATYDNLLATGDVGDQVAAGYGVLLDGAQIDAGNGHDIAVAGTAGSDGVLLDADAGAIVSDVSAILQRAGIGSDFGLTPGISAPGGGVLISSANGDIRLGVGASVANAGGAGGAGGSIVVDGVNLHLVGDDADNPSLFDAGGNGGANGSVTLRSLNSVVVVGQADSGNLPTNDGDSYVSDATINSALNTSSSTQLITTSGQINIAGGSALLRDQGAAPASLSLQAARAIYGGSSAVTANGAWSVRSTSGALDIDLTGQSSVLLEQGTLLSNGGNINIHSVDSNTAALDITGTLIDARVAQLAGNASGNIVLTGQGAEAGVRIGGSQVLSSTGAITIDGRASAAASGASPGVVIANDDVASQIASGSGDITITGIGRNGDNGVTVLNSQVSSANGRVDIAGRGETAGVQLIENAGNVTRVNAGAGVLLTGSATGNGNGLVIGANTEVSSGASMVLRAETATTSNAAITAANSATVSAASTIDLRPGGLAADATRGDNTATNIVIGSGNGFVLDTVLLGRLAAPNLVVGSSTHSGNIRVQGATTLASNLTLQNGSGGITLDNSLNIGDHTLALSSAGNITQNGGGITAHSLLALSSGGAVSLNSATNNIQANTLAGSAAQGFSYVNANALGVGTVVANGFDPAANAPSTLSASGVASTGDVLLQALAGDLILNGNVSGANIDLVAGGVFNNAGNASVTGSGVTRIWAADFAGENRGGIIGVNRYNCSFGGACGVGLPGSGVAFIYQVQPVLSIDIADASREYGLANPALLYTVSGLVNGDTQAAALQGAPTTTATITSNVGDYAINGAFLSALGYALAVDPGNLAITKATLTYTADIGDREYGLANPLFSGTVSGFRNGDTLADATTGTLAFTSPATAQSNVGSYAINGGGLSAGNYDFVQAAGNASALTITQATLSYVANGASREYGLANPALGGSVSGFRNNDSVASATTGTLVFTTTANEQSNVGNYAILGSGLDSLNYKFVQAPGNANALEITQATLSYVADRITREYGLANPGLSGSVTGFRNDDSIASATTGTLAFSTGATSGSNVGDYAVTGSGLDSLNYRFVQASGNAAAFGITPATLQYVADPAARGLGSPNPSLSGSVTGLRNGDTLAGATVGNLVFTTSADANSPVGTYAVTGSGLSAQNYVLVQAPGNVQSLAVVPVIALPAVAEVINLPVTDLYANNFGPVAAICTTSTSDPGAVGGGNDPLAHDWSLLRSKPNLASCVDAQKKNSCSAGF